MRLIKKSSPEPSVLLEYRKTSGNSGHWNDLPTTEKDVVRERLLEDQGYLCCYCMRRIDMAGMKVEHFLPRGGPDGDPRREIDWSNLLGACDGNEGQRRSEQTCDTRKGSKKLVLDPREAKHMQKVRYLADGILKVGRNDHELQKDVDEILNLNSKVLVRSRKNALDGFLLGLAKRLGEKGSWPAGKLERELNAQRSKTRFIEYFGILEKWLERQIDRKNSL